MMTSNEAANLVDECYKTCEANLPPILEDRIRQVQLDAFKAGMIEAANIIKTYGVLNSVHKSNRGKMPS